MSNLITIDKNFSKDSNFWDINPQLIFMKPFSELYNRDKDKNKKTSSNEMWYIFFMEDSDEDLNKFYRIPQEERSNMLFETFDIKVDISDKNIIKCREAYNNLCLNAIEKTFKEQKDYLVKRSKALVSMDYNLDTMKNIDFALGQSLKIYKDYEKIEEIFNKEKKSVHIKGGRKLTLSEKGFI
jgi:hypothetical protein